jgi:hypothetical protein
MHTVESTTGHIRAPRKPGDSVPTAQSYRSVSAVRCPGTPYAAATPISPLAIANWSRPIGQDKPQAPYVSFSRAEEDTGRQLADCTPGCNSSYRPKSLHLCFSA